MKKIKVGKNFIVFLLFFGAGLLEAFKTRNWAMAVFWIVIGIAFLVADNLKKHNQQNTPGI